MLYESLHSGFARVIDYVYRTLTVFRDKFYAVVSVGCGNPYDIIAVCSEQFITFITISYYKPDSVICVALYKIKCRILKLIDHYHGVVAICGYYLVAVVPMGNHEAQYIVTVQQEEVIDLLRLRLTFIILL